MIEAFYFISFIFSSRNLDDNLTGTINQNYNKDSPLFCCMWHELLQWIYNCFIVMKRAFWLWEQFDLNCVGMTMFEFLGNFVKLWKWNPSSITKPPKNSIKKKRRKLLNYQKRQMHNCNFSFLLKKVNYQYFNSISIDWKKSGPLPVSISRKMQKKNYWTYNWCTRKNKMQLSKCSFISMFFCNFQFFILNEPIFVKAPIHDLFNQLNLPKIKQNELMKNRLSK